MQITSPRERNFNKEVADKFKDNILSKEEQKPDDSIQTFQRTRTKSSFFIKEQD
jgi:hypothetical protein